jgi:hypothetical protein
MDLQSEDTGADLQQETEMETRKSSISRLEVILFLVLLSVLAVIDNSKS